MVRDNQRIVEDAFLSYPSVDNGGLSSLALVTTGIGAVKA